MTFSSCLTDKDSGLVLDSSVLINLLATGVSSSIFRALAVQVVVTENVMREIELGAVTGRMDLSLLEAMVGDKVLRVVELKGEALATFFSLVSGATSESLGDGEAATLAFANTNSCVAAIDEKKATRLAADRFTSLRLITTVDILAHSNVRDALGDVLLADAAVRALRLARMQVREHQFCWVARLIGEDKVESCSSLRRLARRRGPQ